MAELSKIRVSGTTYEFTDSKALHTIDDNVTSGGTNAVKGSGVYNAITASTKAALDSVASTLERYATSGDIATLFGDVSYDSTTKRINFKHSASDSNVLAYLDATPFIKDGMVESVVLKDGYEWELIFNDIANRSNIELNPPTNKFVFKCDSAHTIAFEDNNDVGYFYSQGSQAWMHTQPFEKITEETVGIHYHEENGEIMYIADGSGIVMKNIQINGTQSLAEVYKGTPNGKVLSITFNTDASKETIDVSLGDLFDASNYVDAATYTAYTASTATALQGKQDALTPGNGIAISNGVISSNFSIDSTLSTTSENAVQNKVVNDALGLKNPMAYVDGDTLVLS